MKRDDLNHLACFAVVAEQRSFTRAAAQLGMSQSALSHAMKALEERIGARLLARTTRSVSTTDAGETLLRALRPALEDIVAGFGAVGALHDRPTGTVRITATSHAIRAVLMPVLPSFLAAHPNVSVEAVAEDSLVDIVSSRFDAGIRFRELVEKDMIAVPVGPALRMAVVAAPSYFAQHVAPRTPRELARHRCIGYRSVQTGALIPWEFEENGRPFEVRVDGPLAFNDGSLILDAALAGHGIAYLFADTVTAHLAAGTLVSILEKWSPPFPGYYLYHPSRRQTRPALAALIAALQYRGLGK